MSLFFRKQWLLLRENAEDGGPIAFASSQAQMYGKTQGVAVLNTAYTTFVYRQFVRCTQTFLNPANYFSYTLGRQPTWLFLY